ncbi:MAG: hypothetical protein M3R69_05330, partial [Acidobacteriota bacterium]|nr:hypothetical protein [Acidobacteriota bacterium]
ANASARLASRFRTKTLEKFLWSAPFKEARFSSEVVRTKIFIVQMPGLLSAIHGYKSQEN